jgi:hypothetical protein
LHFHGPPSPAPQRHSNQRPVVAGPLSGVGLPSSNDNPKIKLDEVMALLPFCVPLVVQCP